MERSEQAQIFLTKMYQQIESGLYDEKFTIPFMERNLFFKLVQSKVDHKEENKSNPLLTEEEINYIIKDLKETSINIIALYIKLGFIEKINGIYDLTDKGKKAIRISVLQSVGLI